MSFSYEIKDILCKTEYVCPGCRRAELAGFFSFPAKLRSDAGHCLCSGNSVSQRVAAAVNEELGACAEADERRILLGNGVAEKLLTLLSEEVIINDCCAMAYVRGAFLAAGSVSDPEKAYHIELATSSFDKAQYMIHLLEKNGLTPRGTRRRGRLVVYLKESAQIAELIGRISGGMAGLEIFSAQVEKELKSSAQRRVNCDSANLKKQTKASAKQLMAIRKIKKAGRWGAMPKTLREMGAIRLENPDLSLEELGALLDPPIGKSGVNHRLKRIIEFADEC